MTGLDRILSQIKLESDTAAASVLSDARAEADKLLRVANTHAESECTEISQRSAAEVADILARAQSAAALQKKKAVLTEKQKIIGETIAMAKDSLCNLTDDKYFEVILKMVKKFSLPQSGEILFSARDLNRLPSGFEATIAAALPDAQAKLAISKETRKIDGGFVLSYGGVEENCSFTALFDSAREILQDKVHELLFA